MKRMLALGYLHVTFLLKVRSHLAKSGLLQTFKLKGNKRAFFSLKNRIKIHLKVSITGGTYVTFKFVYLLIKEK
jgi:hypothetical protein